MKLLSKRSAGLGAVAAIALAATAIVTARANPIALGAGVELTAKFRVGRPLEQVPEAGSDIAKATSASGE